MNRKLCASLPVPISLLHPIFMFRGFKVGGIVGPAQKEPKSVASFFYRLSFFLSISLKEKKG